MTERTIVKAEITCWRAFQRLQRTTGNARSCERSQEIRLDDWASFLRAAERQHVILPHRAKVRFWAELFVTLGYIANTTEAFAAFLNGTKPQKERVCQNQNGRQV